MRAFRPLLLVLLCYAATSFAAPARDESIKELMTISESKKLVDGIRNQFDGVMTGTIQQVLQGKTPTPAEQKAITRMKDRMVALYRNELSWEKVEPMYIRLYRETFSEEEITGMIDFYRTPTGQAMIKKMPLLMQKTMGEMQKVIVGMSPQLNKIQQDFLQDMKNAGGAEKKH